MRSLLDFKNYGFNWFLASILDNHMEDDPEVVGHSDGAIRLDDMGGTFWMRTNGAGWITPSLGACLDQ